MHGRAGAVNPARTGTKAAAHYALTVPAGESVSVRLRFSPRGPEDVAEASPFAAFDDTMAARQREADEFYATVIPPDLTDDARAVMRQSLAGLLWSKQYYHYVVKTWLEGDPAQPAPPPERRHGRNAQWGHLFNADVISMPDKWEYPWYAAWDLAFHCVPLALVDAEFAKEQLVLMLREWYMHPNGQLPAYEWAFGDVNPPVHAWAAWRVYKIDKKRSGIGDRVFLERVFQKLLLNFTWWVNRKDAHGSNVFEGGFLGLDNIGVFDSIGAAADRRLPRTVGRHQLDGDVLAEHAGHRHGAGAPQPRLRGRRQQVLGALPLHRARDGPPGQGRKLDLWDEEDGFFYDVLHLPDGMRHPLKIRSMVGLIPLFAVETLEPDMIERLDGFRRRLEWFVEHRPDLTENVACMKTPGREAGACCRWSPRIA